MNEHRPYAVDLHRANRVGWVEALRPSEEGQPMNAPDKCPGCGSPAATRWTNGTEYECIAWVYKTGEFMPSVPCVAIQRDQLRAQVEQWKAYAERLEEALVRIANCADAPDIDAGGEIQVGLHCGVEDRSCSDRYEGADFGYSRGVERALEWAVNEAEHTLKSAKENKP